MSRAVAPVRDQVLIATRVSARDDGRRDCPAQQVVASCGQSLRRLGTDRIDLYQIPFKDPRCFFFPLDIDLPRRPDCGIVSARTAVYAYCPLIGAP